MTDNGLKAEIDRFLGSHCRFDGFIDYVPRDGELWLRTDEKAPAIPEKKWVPAYKFSIMLGDERVGGTDLRIGYAEGLYYGGNIGYNILEKHRGKGYAPRAVKMLAPFLEAHEMTTALITNEIHNSASRRVCEKLHLTFLRQAELPEWTDLYKSGNRFVNIFKWRL
ncbi:MAG: GNAT family N-acetyltransferase [Eubacteriales bacterium]|nr:GNAT family N-acetyltransferase [Eubacteriales bacterium]MDD3881969.1 GNAT family N-acetyltransferase [Eubacteriales bacterium]MDD4513130.1 GNAT family N-acetyltransferase [Eubacteriales bacterium]